MRGEGEERGETGKRRQRVWGVREKDEKKKPDGSRREGIRKEMEGRQRDIR